MLKIKTFILSLFLFSITSYASDIPKIPVDAQHPFLKIGGDSLESVYIGAFGDMLPTNLPNGDILVASVLFQDVASKISPQVKHQGISLRRVARGRRLKC